MIYDWQGSREINTVVVESLGWEKESGQDPRRDPWKVWTDFERKGWKRQFTFFQDSALLESQIQTKENLVFMKSRWKMNYNEDNDKGSAF